VDCRPDLRQWLTQASGQHTVPQVFINGQSIGGYTETAQLAKSGELDDLLATAPSVDNPAVRT
jgi:glutaredoxin 3